MYVKELRGKKVLITGGASGIGKALAMRFCAEGSELVLVDIDEDGLAKAVCEIESRGGKCSGFNADLMDRAQVELLHLKVKEEVGPPDVVINVAGIALVGRFEEIPVEVWERVIGINLMGYIYVTHYFLPDMIARGSGHIANVASAAGLFGMPFQAPYSAAKFGVVGMSEVLRWEMSRYGIGVTTVCPGSINTPIVESAACIGFDDAKVRRNGYAIAATPERLVQAVVKGIKKDSALVVFPRFVRSIWWVKRISPHLGDALGKGFTRIFYWQHK
jgi:NAD(P)-dependent dehydrogenase (short-subunit alcohol dehydrogenase family)